MTDLQSAEDNVKSAPNISAGKRGRGGIANVFSALAMLSYWASHIIAAIALFRSVRLWSFLVMLCIPIVGDFMAVIQIIALRIWWPLALYGAFLFFMLLAVVCSLIADKTPLKL